jgi:hypothetical protein
MSEEDIIFLKNNGDGDLKIITSEKTRTERNMINAGRPAS